MFLIPKSYWEIRETKSKGRGVFAKKPISKATVIGDYTGKLIHIKDIDFEGEKKNLYLMNYSDKIGIYPDLRKSGVHLINHSCSPNCWIYKYKEHTLVFALKKIQKDEELTISYLLPPKMSCNNCTHTCFCGGKNCTGSMHLTEEKYRKWRNFQEKQKGKVNKISIKRGKLKPLSYYPMSVPKSYITKIIRLRII